MSEETNRRRVPMIPGPPRTSVTREPAIPGLGQQIATHTRPFGPIGKIAGAIASVMANVGTIEQRGINKFHGYKYTLMGDLLAAITPRMGQAGLAVIQNEVEIKQVENRVAVTYEFSLIHESNEIWPERPRFTGMAIARDSKGNWDDKCISKCHTAARKYFLLALFQVPAGDFDDADDADNANQRKPVPSPGAAKAAPAKEAAAAPEENQPAEHVKPQKIGLGAGAGPDQWANRYIQMIGQCTSEQEIADWDKFNDATLQMLSDRYSKIYEMIATAVQRRLLDVAPRKEGAMPDPKADSQEAMNWVAAQLQQIKTYPAAESFWNTYVAPREKEFDDMDWEMLMGEWERAVTRLAPQSAPPDDAAQAGA